MVKVPYQSLRDLPELELFLSQLDQRGQLQGQFHENQPILHLVVKFVVRSDFPEAEFGIDGLSFSCFGPRIEAHRTIAAVSSLLDDGLRQSHTRAASLVFGQHEQAFHLTNCVAHVVECDASNVRIFVGRNE